MKRDYDLKLIINHLFVLLSILGNDELVEGVSRHLFCQPFSRTRAGARTRVSVFGPHGRRDVAVPRLVRQGHG